MFNRMVAEFMAQARELLAGGVDKKSLEAVGRLLAESSHKPGFVTEGEMKSLHGSESSFTILQSDPDGMTLMLSRFSPEAATAVHDHKSWGVLCVVRGHDRYVHFELTGEGDVRVLYEKELEPGAFVTWLGPPHDIHSQQGIDGDAMELVLFGKDVTKTERNYYDAETGKQIKR
jgi:predicted metal-dependent enzyme (double-stranded beta helix superfamily)